MLEKMSTTVPSLFNRSNSNFSIGEYDYIKPLYEWYSFNPSFKDIISDAIGMRAIWHEVCFNDERDTIMVINGTMPLNERSSITWNMEQRTEFTNNVKYETEYYEEYYED